MASGGKEKKDEEGSGADWFKIGAGILTAVGAAVGAAVAGKMAYDYMKEETSDAPMEPEDKSCGSEYPERRPSRPQRSSPPVREPLTPPVKAKPLLNQFIDYHDTYASPRRSEMQRAKRVVEEIKQMVMSHLQETCPSLGIGQLMHTGSVYEGLKVIRPDEFDVMMPLKLEPKIWKLDEGKASLRGADGYWFVRRKELGSIPLGASPWDKSLIGDCLSPSKIISRFIGLIQKGINRQESTSEYEIRLRKSGPAITLDVRYDGYKHLSIDLVPAVSVGGVCVVAKNHPRALQSFSDTDFQNLWRRSYSEEEKDKLRKMDLQDGGCRLKCLRIVKAIRLNHRQQFGMLPSYVYKTLLFHLVDMEDEWHQEALAERIIDMFKTLEGYLKSGNLDHYFDPHVNLLEGCSPTSLNDLACYIARIVGRNDWSRLLQVRGCGSNL